MGWKSFGSIPNQRGKFELCSAVQCTVTCGCSPHQAKLVGETVILHVFVSSSHCVPYLHSVNTVPIQ